MYTINNVIIDRDNLDARNAIGKECYTGKTPYECLSHALNKEYIHTLKKVHNRNQLPFEIQTKEHSFTSKYACIIIRDKNEE